MAQDNTNNFNRPIPLRQNEILRNNLSAPKDGANSDNPSFPIGDISPTNRQAQKTPVNRGSITRRDTDTTKDVSIGLQDYYEW